MKLLRIFTLAVGLLLITAAPASARKWSDASGKFSVHATLVESKDGNVRLRRIKDGKIITVPVSKLSKADQRFLADVAIKKSEATKLTPDEAVAAIKKLGGTVRVDENGTVVFVSLDGLKINDAQLAHLTGLTKLTYLNIGSNRITNAGLKHLKGLTELVSLDLLDTKITDAGLVNLKGMTKLRILGLNNTNVTDAGLIHLKGMGDLRILALHDTKVTDAGLKHLMELRTLVSVRLSDTGVTDKGAKKLKQALPNCIIDRFSVKK